MSSATISKMPIATANPYYAFVNQLIDIISS